MEISMRIVLVLPCLLYTGLRAYAQDERTFQVYVKQAQRYESEKHYGHALNAYRKAQPYASADARKNLEKTIERLDELAQQQQLVNEGLAGEIQKQTEKLTSQLHRSRIRDALQKLQQQEYASKEDYHLLLRQVEETKQIELTMAKGQTATRPSAPVSPPKNTLVTQTAVTLSGPTGPPAKTITSSMPVNTIKTNPEVRTAKSATALLNNSGKPK